MKISKSGVFVGNNNSSSKGKNNMKTKRKQKKTTRSGVNKTKRRNKMVVRSKKGKNKRAGGSGVSVQQELFQAPQIEKKDTINKLEPISKDSSASFFKDTTRIRDWDDTETFLLLQKMDELRKRPLKPIPITTEALNNYTGENAAKLPDTTSKPGTSKNYMTGGAGDKFLWIFDSTELLVNEFIRINPRLRQQNTSSVSIFNQGLTWLEDFNGSSFYVCTPRINAVMDDSGRLLDRTQMASDFRVFSQVVKYLQPTNGSGSNNFFAPNGAFNPAIIAAPGFDPDIKDTKYLSYPGSIYNYWVAPTGLYMGSRMRGALGRGLEATMLTIIERTGDSFIPRYSKMLNDMGGLLYAGGAAPWDARIINSYNSQSIPGTNENGNIIYVVGSIGRTDATLCPVAPAAIEPGHRPGVENNTINQAASVYSNYNGEFCDIQNRQGISIIQVLKRKLASGQLEWGLGFPGNQVSPFAYPQDGTNEALANCISWRPNLDKNYAPFYYHYPDPNRAFMPETCLMIQFDMTSGPSDINPSGGMAFYCRSHNIDDHLGRNNYLNGKTIDSPPHGDRSWKLIHPPNSDIFIKLEALYKDSGIRISSTTPFLDDGNSLIAVGHVKMDIWKYLDTKMRQYLNANPGYNPASDGYAALINYFTIPAAGRQKDHLFAYGLGLIEHIVANVVNDPDHGIGGDRQFLSVVNINARVTFADGRSGKFFFNAPPGGGLYSSNPIYTFIQDEAPYIRNFCIYKKMAFVVPGRPDHYVAVRNFHPKNVYFMFLYKINKNTLELETFSHPFMLLKNSKTCFLNFPMGLTTNGSGDEKQLWLTYGDGDCSCWLAAFNDNQLNKLLYKDPQTRQIPMNNNMTPVNDVEFWLYRDGDIG